MDEVSNPHRNPPWSREELILALDLYFDVGGALEVDDPRVAALSGLLQRLTIHPGALRGPSFRNANGVSMKLMNIQRLDPKSPGKGLSAGGHLEEVLWAELSGDQQRLRGLAAAIRDSASHPPADAADPADAEAYSEGRYLYRIHRDRERSASLVRRKKQKAWQAGRLFCEVCGLRPEDLYGEGGVAALECHHVIPLSSLNAASKTKLEDLALVCASCHRVLHASRPPLVPIRLAEGLQATVTLVAKRA
jgi:5-methylcytosine-specific restriction protein A